MSNSALPTVKTALLQRRRHQLHSAARPGPETRPPATVQADESQIMGLPANPEKEACQAWRYFVGQCPTARETPEVRVPTDTIPTRSTAPWLAALRRPRPPSIAQQTDAPYEADDHFRRNRDTQTSTCAQPARSQIARD